LHGVPDTLDHVWQLAANGGYHAWKVWTTPFPTTALSDLHLQESLNGVVEDLGKVVRTAIDGIAAHFAGGEAVTPAPPPLPVDQPESAPSEDIPEEKLSPAVSLITPLFLAGFRPPKRQEAGRRRTGLAMTAAPCFFLGKASE